MIRHFNPALASMLLSGVAFAAPDKGTGSGAAPGPTGETAASGADNKTSEAASASVPAVVGGVHGATLAIGGLLFKAKQVTRNLIKQEIDKAIYVQITGKIYQGEQLKGAKLNASGKPEMEPARLAECVNLETKSLSLIIINAVLEGALNDVYPNDGYIGKSFAIIMRPGPEGKRYKTFELFELETDGEVAA